MPSRRGESKACSEDAREEDVHFSEEVLAAAILFCASPAFEHPVAAFKDQHWRVFAEYATSEEKAGGDAEGVEHSLECHEVFDKFQELVESLLEEFTMGGSSSSRSVAQEFLRECADAVEGKFVPLFEEHENKWFVDMVFSWMEYKSFFAEMVSLAAEKGGRANHK